MTRRRPPVATPPRFPHRPWGLMLAILCLSVAPLALRPALAQTGPDTVSGLYVHEADPRATVKLLMAPSEKDGAPVDRVWGVVSFKDPHAKADSCMFEFQSTLKGDRITCRDALNPGCAIQLQLVDRTVILDTAPGCFAIYCKGRGMIVRGIYVRTTAKAKKSRLP